MPPFHKALIAFVFLFCYCPVLALSPEKNSSAVVLATFKDTQKNLTQLQWQAAEYRVEKRCVKSGFGFPGEIDNGNNYGPEYESNQGFNQAENCSND